jgi:osmotically inducible protein OsmC
MTTESGVLSQARYAMSVPLRKTSGTNPAELIAAAHAGSFSMALSHELGLARSALGSIATTATVTLQNLSGIWSIINLHLNVLAKLPKVTQGQFIDATVRAKTTCLISKLLRANLSMNAKLEK